MDVLSPAVQSYLRQRVSDAVSDAGADTPWLLPSRWDIKLYQGLGDSHSAAALCRDLLALAQQDNSSPPSAGLLAVFECEAASGGAADFAACLARHLHLMRRVDARLGDIESIDSSPDPSDDALQLQILDRSFRLIALHADAERLSRVLPCPVLAFTALSS